MNLQEWQTQFRNGMRSCGPINELFEPVPLLEGRFFVYSNGYWLRVSESVLEDFPLTTRLVGLSVLKNRLRGFLEEKQGYELELGEVSRAFATFLLSGSLSHGVERALRLDLLALESFRAPEPVADLPGGFGLHPSVRFFSLGERHFCLWREDGVVMRERISSRERSLLWCFSPCGTLEELSARLDLLGEEPAFVQSKIAEWTAAGAIVSLSE